MCARPRGILALIVSPWVYHTVTQLVAHWNLDVGPPSLIHGAYETVSLKAASSTDGFYIATSSNASQALGR